MLSRGLTGSRIRERRMLVRRSQARLAEEVGISAAYLSLIEHNRRRIGGKLLADIARQLDVSVGSLAEGVDLDLVSALRAGAAGMIETGAEVERVEEFARRFPGWAGLLAAQTRRIGELERMIESLADRVAHDPHLALSLHELLSAVTSIRSAASILVETRNIEDEWRDRFHRNIHEDSQRLAETSQSLVSYLEVEENEKRVPGSPQEELENWLEGRDYHIDELERAQPATPDTLLWEAPEIGSQSGRALAERHFRLYRSDAERMPLRDFRTEAEKVAFDPVVLSARFNVDPAAALRRVASLPTPKGLGRIGVVVCDASGTLTFRKPVDGFPLPRFGAACPLWPLFQALNRPYVPIRALFEMCGREPVRFLVYAIAQPMGLAGFDAPQVFEGTMLILPADRVAFPELPVLSAGTSCRICPNDNCDARREMSILAREPS